VLFVPAHVLPAYTRPPAVVTVHDLGYLLFPEAHTRAQRLYLDVTTRRHARRATAVIADSTATKDDLVAHYGADPAKVHVVHLAADESLGPVPAAEVGEARARLGVPPDRPYILHVGTVQPRKNLARLVRAFAGLSGFDPPPTLVLAGKRGWGDVDLPRLASELGVASDVLLLGYVDRDLLPPLYSGASVVTVPSLYEGFGLPALEAMACGAPVAVSGTSSLPEVVGDAGLQFDPLDVGDITSALHRLLSDASLRDTLSRSGLLRAAEFSWDACASRTQAVLELAASARVAGFSAAVDGAPSDGAR
jgi:glycosyltransferase involved in cell wall biosynthesis